MKLFSLFLALTLTSGCLLAQTNVAGNRSVDDGSAVRVGIRAGASAVLPLERIDGATYQFSAGYLGGLVLNVGRGRLSLQPEINYSQAIAKAAVSLQGFSASVQATSNLVEVPLLVKASFGEANKTRFFVNAGPYGAYVTNATLKARLISVPDGLDPTLQSALEQLLSQTRKIEFATTNDRFSYGVAGGLGVALKAGPGQLTLEGRAMYELGGNLLNSVSSANPGVSVSTNVSDTKYLRLQAAVGYLIPLGGQ